MYDKYCPFSFSDPGFVNCLQEECVLWSDDTEKCAIVEIKDSLRFIATKGPNPSERTNM